MYNIKPMKKSEMKTGAWYWTVHASENPKVKIIHSDPLLWTGEGFQSPGSDCTVVYPLPEFVAEIPYPNQNGSWSKELFNG